MAPRSRLLKPSAVRVTSSMATASRRYNFSRFAFNSVDFCDACIGLFSSCFNHAGSRQRLDISSVYHSPISYVTFLSYISVYSDLCLLFITTTKCYGAAHACLPILSTEYPTTRTNTYRAAPFHVIPYIGKRYVVT